MITLGPDRAITRAASELVARGLMLVPVVWCHPCGQTAPVDHDCTRVRPFSAIEARLAADLQAATIHAISPPDPLRGWPQ